MHKSAFLKKRLISVMLVALVVIFVPVISAVPVSDAIVVYGSHGEGVGYDVVADQDGSLYYNCYWHCGVWLCTGVSYVSLSWTFYANGATLETGTTFISTTHDLGPLGPYSSIADSATGAFRYNGGSVYYLSGSSQAHLP